MSHLSVQTKLESFFKPALSRSKTSIASEPVFAFRFFFVVYVQRLLLPRSTQCKGMLQFNILRLLSMDNYIVFL
jgi:hypothetical protein